jgi:probable rRNA maturation factor
MHAKQIEREAFAVERDVRSIENRQKRVRLAIAATEGFLLRLNRELGLQQGTAFVRFVTDAEMKRLNQKFRNKAKTTDVLSFPAETRTRPRGLRARTKKLRGVYLGDIAISPAVARRNAKMFGRTTAEEICVLMLHGVLHLLGYDHESDSGEMGRLEARLRRRLGLGG